MAGQPELADVIKEITADVTTIVKGEIELVKAELLPQAKSVGIGAGMFGGAGFLAMSAGSLLLISLSIGFGELFAMWGMKQFGALALGFTVVAVLLLIGAAILALLGKNKVSVKGPQRTVEQGQESVEAVKTAVERGKETAETEAAVRKAARKDVPMITARREPGPDFAPPTR